MYLLQTMAVLKGRLTGHFRSVKGHGQRPQGMQGSAYDNAPCMKYVPEYSATR